MSEGTLFRFTINGPYTPETIPMARLAEYMADIAIILGEQADVHFVKVSSGSTVLHSLINPPAAPKVRARVDQTRRGEGPPEATLAFRRVNRRLREDASRATLTEDTAEILAFPGCEEIQPVQFAAFSQDSVLDGVVIRLGGRGDWVPVHIESENHVFSQCQARRSVAKRLGEHIFTDELRIKGTGRWYVNDVGDWVLERFTISDFEVLDPAPLTDVVRALRAMPNNGWEQVEDPWAELKALRDGPSAVH